MIQVYREIDPYFLSFLRIQPEKAVIELFTWLSITCIDTIPTHPGTNNNGIKFALPWASNAATALLGPALFLSKQADHKNSSNRFSCA
ncbi:hypothetical protein NSND_62968 [Nitrospira sp. ND1]|nr:hypothetical protein NSND_62968 [Nitrospira sp. ND1]